MSPSPEPLLREALAALAEASRAAIEEAAKGRDPGPAAAALGRLAAAAAGDSPEELLLAAKTLPWALPASARIKEAGEGLSEARALAACAAEVIAAVPRSTEAATFAIIERFEAVRSMTSRAAEAARGARGLFSGEEGSSLLSTAKGSREAVVSERLAVAEIAARNKASAKALREIHKAVDDGIELLRGIEDITERSRLIAFNLAVEAAHFGDKGRGFKIIAGELRSLNDRTEDFSGKVTGLLERLGSESADLERETAEETDRMVSEAEKGMGATERAVESLIGASQETERFAREIAALAERIDADMSGVLESLQFQDITRQVVEGAAAMLGELPPILAAARSALPEFDRGDRLDAERFEAVRSRLVAAAKTKDEKEALAKARP